MGVEYCLSVWLAPALSISFISGFFFLKEAAVSPSVLILGLCDESGVSIVDIVSCLFSCEDF